MHLRFIVLVAAGFLAASTCQASNYYTEAGITANTVDTGTAKYRPLTASAKLSYALSPNYSIDANFATNIHKAEKDNEQLKLRNLTGLYLRYASPLLDKGVQAYVSAGYSYVTLDITDATAGNYFEDHKGPTFSLGLEKKLTNKIKFILEYIRFTDDKSRKFVISGITAGVRTMMF